MQYKLIRMRRKTVSILISSDKMITVKAPIACPQEKIDAFLQSKRSWIDKQLSFVEQNSAQFSEIIEQKVILICGNRYRIAKSDDTRLKKAVFCDRILWIPTSKPADQLLKKFISDYTFRLLTELLPQIAEKLSVSYQKFSLSNARGKWGSCSQSAALKFNNKLSMLPSNLIEYVVIHELCHVKHLNHSKNFWRAVESFCPDYKARKASLKNYAFITSLYN